jgi:hypothetical protein
MKSLNVDCQFEKKLNTKNFIKDEINNNRYIK